MHKSLNSVILDMMTPKKKKPVQGPVGDEGKSIDNVSKVEEDDLRAQRQIKIIDEEAAQLDEISDKLKDKYIYKAVEDYGDANAHRKEAESTNRPDVAAKMRKRMKKRNQGMSRAFGEKVNEEAAQLDEVSTKLLKRYIKKADKSYYSLSKKSDEYGDKAMEIDGSKNEKNAARQQKWVDKAAALSRPLRNRITGIKTASDKLGKTTFKRAQVMAKEETEQLDEISKEKLGKYIPTALDSMRDQDQRAAYHLHWARKEQDPDERTGEGKKYAKAVYKSMNRAVGIKKAAKKLAAEGRYDAMDRIMGGSPKSSISDRRAAERSNHQFSDSIGGHSSNYREPKFGTGRSSVNTSSDKKNLRKLPTGMWVKEEVTLSDAEREAIRKILDSE